MLLFYVSICSVDLEAHGAKYWKGFIAQLGFWLQSMSSLPMYLRFMEIKKPRFVGGFLFRRSKCELFLDQELVI